MRSDVGRIGDRRLAVGVDGERCQYSVEDASCVPPGKLRVDRLPRTEALGQITPRHASLGDEEHGVHERPVGQLGRSRLAASLRGQQWRDTIPFVVG